MRNKTAATEDALAAATARTAEATHEPPPGDPALDGVPEARVRIAIEAWDDADDAVRLGEVTLDARPYLLSMTAAEIRSLAVEPADWSDPFTPEVADLDGRLHTGPWTVRGIDPAAVIRFLRHMAGHDAGDVNGTDVPDDLDDLTEAHVANAAAARPAIAAALAAARDTRVIHLARAAVAAVLSRLVMPPGSAISAHAVLAPWLATATAPGAAAAGVDRATDVQRRLIAAVGVECGDDPGGEPDLSDISAAEAVRSATVVRAAGLAMCVVEPSRAAAVLGASLLRARDDPSRPDDGVAWTMDAEGSKDPGPTAHGRWAFAGHHAGIAVEEHGTVPRGTPAGMAVVAALKALAATPRGAAVTLRVADPLAHGWLTGHGDPGEEHLRMLVEAVRAEMATRRVRLRAR